MDRALSSMAGDMRVWLEIAAGGTRRLISNEAPSREFQDLPFVESLFGCHCGRRSDCKLLKEAFQAIIGLLANVQHDFSTTSIDLDLTLQ